MDLKTKIQTSINEVSRENESDTPDYILAQFLISCLESYERAVNMRDVKAGVDKGVPSPRVDDGCPSVTAALSGQR